MRLIVTFALASLYTFAMSGFYVCKTQAMTHKDECGVTLDCATNCKKYTWNRGYCGAGLGECYTKTAKNGGTATVHVEERDCVGSYGCQCEAGDLAQNYSYVGKVQNCSSTPYPGGTNLTIGEEEPETNEGPAPAAAG